MSQSLPPDSVPGGFRRGGPAIGRRVAWSHQAGRPGDRGGRCPRRHRHLRRVPHDRRRRRLQRPRGRQPPWGRLHVDLGHGEHRVGQLGHGWRRDCGRLGRREQRGWEHGHRGRGWCRSRGGGREIGLRWVGRCREGEPGDFCRCRVGRPGCVVRWRCGGRRQRVARCWVGRTGCRAREHRQLRQRRQLRRTERPPVGRGREHGQWRRGRGDELRPRRDTGRRGRCRRFLAVSPGAESRAVRAAPP